jgi:hypothetical protein
LVCNPETNKCLLSCGIRVADVNFTQYSRGIFNSDAEIEGLIQNLRLRDKSKYKETRAENPIGIELDSAMESHDEATILDNNSTVRGNCLTFALGGRGGR